MSDSTLPLTQDEAADLRHKLRRSEDRIAALLKNVGDPGHCKGCTQAITWVRHGNGKAVPYDADGTNHFATCRVAANFKRAGR